MCSGKWNIYFAKTFSRMPASLAHLGIASFVGTYHLVGGLLEDATWVVESRSLTPVMPQATINLYDLIGILRVEIY
jgi:hypothetical protein